ncbi:hypothetical protein CONCODRAFT_12304 [Conidiobolus coronatus NRRL 28638]|uniref:F-box domain-containing protein n=1 Tax=Conidiobolus coronatus (strain ATCC 28846 / CBS 209.66 / NRRL 28638) TaxID=796925 RepID=A0A137NTD2_CONC2|nr:hypothetical protein CONCODRAFT_12304 [Conidiobolus coronatus NRRL 28638]|eukprot:KXN65971.1 hypothetical protein CONCODRAFT_12304 [Conidiobolus coronatus NRRL 28638]
MKIASNSLENSLSNATLPSKHDISNSSNVINHDNAIASEVKGSSIQKSVIWDISTVLSTIFTFSDFKDLIKFNTVCKKWNIVTNPTIHRSLKLFRRNDIQNIAHGESLNKNARVDAEVEQCIANNSKFSCLVKEFKFCNFIPQHRTEQFFNTFKFITSLTILNIGLSYESFISVIKPLAQLEELKLENIGIKTDDGGESNAEPHALPYTLTRLKLNIISLTGNVDLFAQTINSHINLKEFRYLTYDRTGFLEPFNKSYPSLKLLEFDSHRLESDQILLKVIENNNGLNSIKFKLPYISDSILDNINTHLTSLEELSLSTYSDHSVDISESLFKFNQPTSIKKLILRWEYLSSTSLDSILLNCPCLKDIELQLTDDWKNWIDILHSRCLNLQKITYIPWINYYGKERNRFNQEFYNYTFSNNTSQIGNTLVDLTLANFNFNIAKSSYFKDFAKLKSLTFTTPYNFNCCEWNNKLNSEIWSDYRLKEYKCSSTVLIKLEKFEI